MSFNEKHDFYSLVFYSSDQIERGTNEVVKLELIDANEGVTH